jgi:hypothetical protein
MYGDHILVGPSGKFAVSGKNENGDATFLRSSLPIDKLNGVKFIFSILVICAMFLSCKKKSTMVSFQNEGILTGMNLLTCPCVDSCPCLCGSYFFHFTNYSDTSNVVIVNSTILKLPSQVSFPVQIKLNWTDATRCNIFAVKITSYQIQ